MDQTDFAQPEEKPKGDETEPRRQLQKTTCPRIPPSALTLAFNHTDFSLRNSP